VVAQKLLKKIQARTHSCGDETQLSSGRILIALELYSPNFNSMAFFNSVADFAIEMDFGRPRDCTECSCRLKSAEKCSLKPANGSLIHD